MYVVFYSLLLALVRLLSFSFSFSFCWDENFVRRRTKTPRAQKEKENRNTTQQNTTRLDISPQKLPHKKDQDHKPRTRTGGKSGGLGFQ